MWKIRWHLRAKKSLICEQITAFCAPQVEIGARYCSLLSIALFSLLAALSGQLNVIACTQKQLAEYINIQNRKRFRNKIFHRLNSALCNFIFFVIFSKRMKYIVVLKLRLTNTEDKGTNYQL